MKEPWFPDDPDERRRRIVEYWWHVVFIQGIDARTGEVTVPSCKFCGLVLTPFLAECENCGHPVYRALKKEKDRMLQKPTLDDLGPRKVFGPGHPVWQKPDEPKPGDEEP